MNKLKFSLCSIILLLILGFKGEETPLEKLLKQLAKITAGYPQEKVHLHFDKPYYIVGEDIWLKAYLVTAEKNEPSLLSSVLYIDLINNQTQIKKKLTLTVEKGIASGNISLLDSLGSGTYRVRAYTNYMRNYSEELFYEKFITIGNVLDVKLATKEDKKLDLSIQFFPEGGNLISGIRSKVGFKALTSDGIGANVSGYIINKNKEKVAQFNTEHAGMGVFAMIPQLNEQYTAVLTLDANSTKSYKFPEVLASGQSIAVNSIDKNLVIRISSTPDLINKNDVFVIAQSNGKVYASLQSKIDKATLIANIPISNFPTGIVQVTLFTSDSKPIAERLIFVNHSDQLKIDVLNTASALTKKKMDLVLDVKDVEGNPVDGNFSVSVTDVGKIPFEEDDEKTILSNLLLTSDLKGFIEKPNYYFNAINPDTEKQLDNLLLTQGWSRFLWNDIATEKEPEITFRPEQTLEIAGKVTTAGNKPLPAAKVMMFSNTKGYTLVLDTISDANGNFVFDRLDIPDTASFIIQTKTAKDKKNVNLVLNRAPSVIDRRYIGKTMDILPYVESTKAMFTELNKFNMLDKTIQLNAVNITGRKVLKPLINVPNSANASGAADQVVNNDKLSYETNIFTAVSKIPGVLVKNGMIMRASARTVSITQAQQPMLVILDGVYIRQAEQPGFVASLNPPDIEGIEVLTSNYNTSIYGEDGYWGIIFITTKNGSSGKNPPSSNTSSVRNRGFTLTKQFYSPDYENPKTNQQMQDLRSTIYWNPKVVTNDKGVADFNFFNASTAGTYRVTIEGMDAFGNIGRKVYTYQVK